MTKELQVTNSTKKDQKSVLEIMASRYDMIASEFENVVKQTAMPNKGSAVSDAQFLGFLMVAKEYNLNPLVKEIYAFPAKSGGIQPIVSVDGWCRIINEHPKCDGFEFVDTIDSNENLTAIQCKMFKKGIAHPITVTEYMVECKGDTGPWRKWPRRMLRHKALIQCARYAFGFSGIYDEDEGQRMKDVTPVNAAGIEAAMEEKGELATENRQDGLTSLIKAKEEPKEQAVEPETKEAEVLYTELTFGAEMVIYPDQINTADLSTKIKDLEPDQRTDFITDNRDSFDIVADIMKSEGKAQSAKNILKMKEEVQ
ncbi:hypothetical protein LCGC14_1554750 [marine sediment metagenome]|uniref:Phage recombination protein Bet n=1 Tax=marine sediment metagenome TaxID=412755 RepID=A0A0F9IP96_9ZZZZ